MAPLGTRKLNSALFSFSDTWQILGPFQIGTREATWGADPLEYIGGFRNLIYDPEATFRSSLPTNGSAAWNITEAVQTSYDSVSANATLSIAYSNVDWDFLRVVYGWAAVQYQAWARGELVVGGNETQHVILHTDAVLEYWVDDTHYFGGDFYTFRKAPPVLHLEPGSHKIDLRLVRDVRAFGGILEPTIDVLIDVQQTCGALELAKPGFLMSDVVDGMLASSLGSMFLRNSGQDDVEIIDIKPSSVSPHISLAGLKLDTQSFVARDTDNVDQTDQKSSHGLNGSSIVIVPGQTRPVTFSVSLPGNNVSSLEYDIVYKTASASNYSTLQVVQEVNARSIYQPHKMTFLHPGGTVSYAMLRAPAKDASCLSNQRKLPILLDLHGAGVEADNPELTRALDPVSDLCAWILFPTGVTAWSGDDWHNWGFADVEAAIEAVPSWIQQVGWTGSDVDIDRWIVTGHSNGGQGAWYALTHRPDKIIAAAPLSGYASIQKYVTYELWQPADPRRTAVISAALNNYRHEMLMPNVAGIPVQQQHGEVDDNVPTYHSRFLAQQIQLAGAKSNYTEFPDQNHEWEGMMTTPNLVAFYEEQTKNEVVLPRKLENFTIVVGDPGAMGSKSGVRVVDLEDPGQYGRVIVRGRTIKTSNVKALHFNPNIWQEPVMLDGATLALTEIGTNSNSEITACKSRDGWAVQSPEDDVIQRQGRQLGSMTAILRSQGPFIIRHPGTSSTSQVALQISRNLHQYFQADTVIASSTSYSTPTNLTGNVITLAIGSSLEAAQPPFAVRVGESGVTVNNYRGQEQQYGSEARGAAFLRPLERERLDLVLWGADDEGLRQAARVVPMLTGVGQPDFVVLSESAKWSGIEGALAMGFFDSSWKVTASSIVESV